MAFFGSSWEEDWYSDNNKKYQTNQYFIYGIVIPLWKHRQITYDYGEIPVTDNDVHGIFRGRDGKFFILGKILDSSDCFGQDKPFLIPKLDAVDELIIKNQIKNKFNIEGEFNYYFVTK